jgi:hypothetical protein
MQQVRQLGDVDRDPPRLVGVGSYGARAGSDAYVACRMNLANNRQQAATAASDRSCAAASQMTGIMGGFTKPNARRGAARAGTDPVASLVAFGGKADIEYVSARGRRECWPLRFNHLMILALFQV